MATQQNVVGSVQVGQTDSSTAASANNAGNDTVGVTAGMIPPGAPVVAPKGFRSQLQQMLLGWQGGMPSSSALSSSVGTLTQASVMGQLQAYLGQYQTLDTQATALKQTRVQVKAQLSGMRQYYAALRAALRGFYGEGSPQLEQYGLKPKSTPSLSSKQLAVRAAKVNATRELRGTKGSVQKAAIKAGPMAVSIGPVSSPAASTAQGPGPTSAEPVTSAVSSTPVAK